MYMGLRVYHALRLSSKAWGYQRGSRNYRVVINIISNWVKKRKKRKM